MVTAVNEWSPWSEGGPTSPIPPPYSYISHYDPAAGSHEQLRSWLDAAGYRHEHLREITSEAPTRDEQGGAT